MQALPATFQDQGLTYTQLRREGQVALYQVGKAAPYWEVIVIRSRKERTAVLKGKTTLFPAQEIYPGASEFGSYGWCCSTLAQAEARFDAVGLRRQKAA